MHTTSLVFFVIFASCIGTSTSPPVNCLWLSFEKFPFDRSLAFNTLNKHTAAHLSRKLIPMLT